MSPGKISRRVVADRLDWINKMTKEIESLPLHDYQIFTKDKRNIWSAESCLRRSLEALMDLGRYILVKSLGRGVSEYKEIGVVLEEVGVLDDRENFLFKTLAGYRNRMVHFYHDICDRELFEICSSQLSDIRYIAEAIKTWVNDRQEIIDNSL